MISIRPAFRQSFHRSIKSAFSGRRRRGDVLTPGDSFTADRIDLKADSDLVTADAGEIGGVVYDTDAQAWFDAVSLAGDSINDTNKAAFSAFFAGCKADTSPIGVVTNWAAMKEGCFLCGTAGLTGALVPFKGSAPTNTGFVSGDYSRTLGLTGDGTSYLTSARNNNSEPQNNQSFGVYVTALNSMALSDRFIGTSTSGNPSELLNGATTTGVNLRARSHGSTLAAATNTAGTGLAGVSRHQSADFIVRAFAQSSTITAVSALPKSGTMGIFANSGGANVSEARLSFWWMGEAVDLAALETRLATLMAALT